MLPKVLPPPNVACWGAASVGGRDDCHVPGWFAAGFYGGNYLDTYRRLTDQFHLPPGHKLKGLSKGMRAKVALSLALAHDPELLILDEPTSELDAAAQKEFVQALRICQSRYGPTFLLLSHQLDLIEAVGLLPKEDARSFVLVFPGEVEKVVKGSDLVGLEYEPPFRFEEPQGGKSYVVVPGAHVEVRGVCERCLKRSRASSSPGSPGRKAPRRVSSVTNRRT